MPTIIFLSVTSITTALLCYTLVLFLNRKTKTLTVKQFLILSLGVITDLIGTAMMKSLTDEIRYDLHTISGYLALILMLVMSAIALFALVRKYQPFLTNFSKYYFPVWIIWLISYVTGVVLGIQKIT